jgi:predicted nucleic-acid-binding Zn-ribbon protein
MDQIIKYKCPKCGNGQYQIGEVFGASSPVTRILGIQDRRFTFVSCQMCHFTELYRIPKKKIGEVLNFMAR